MFIYWQVKCSPVEKGMSWSFLQTFPVTSSINLSGRNLCGWQKFLASKWDVERKPNTMASLGIRWPAISTSSVAVCGTDAEAVTKQNQSFQTIFFFFQWRKPNWFNFKQFFFFYLYLLSSVLLRGWPLRKVDLVYLSNELPYQRRQPKTDRHWYQNNFTKIDNAAFGEWFIFTNIPRSCSSILKIWVFFKNKMPESTVS